MSGPSERTPLLTARDHLNSQDETWDHYLKTLPAKSDFKFAIKILRVLVSLLSLAIFGILLAAHVLIATGPFFWIAVEKPRQTVKILAAVLLVNFILSALTVLLHISAIFNIPLDIAMIVAVLIFSEYMTGKGWPDVWDRPNFWKFCAEHPSEGPGWEIYPECARARDVIKILMGVSAGVSIIIVLLLVAVLAFELASLSRKLNTGGETKLVVQFGANPLPNLARLAPDENVSSSGHEA